jgi:NADH-quinone oxidoreductase subunit E
VAEAAPTAAHDAAATGIAPETAEELSAGKPDVKVEMPEGVAEAAPGQNTATGDGAPGETPEERAARKAARAERKAAKAAREGGDDAAAEEAPAEVAPLPLTGLPEGGSQPQALAAPRDGKGDNLQTIEGIGPVLEKLCHDLGIFHFDQIASWGAAEIAWMDANLKGFRGRVTRDKWVAQARLIGEVGIEQFLIRAKSNDY